MLGGAGSGTSSLFYSNLGWIAAVNNVVNLATAGVGIVLGSEGLLGVTGFSYDGTSTFTELAFSNVDLGGCVVGGRAVDCIEVSIVGPILNLDVGGG